METLSPHHFMNFKVEGEGGRQLSMGRNLGSLKAELGAKARGAFQALASLKISNPSSNASHHNSKHENSQTQLPSQSSPSERQEFTHKNSSPGEEEENIRSFEGSFNAWTFGELPELLEIKRKSQTLIGFPALIDEGSSVRIEVFDEPGIASSKHRQGLRRLFSIQIKDSIKYLEKNNAELSSSVVIGFVQAMKNLENALRPDSHKGGAQPNSPGGMTLEGLKPQIMDLALDRAFLLEPLPINSEEFEQRLAQGRTRLTLITTEIARLVQTVLTEFCAAARKLKDTPTSTPAQSDMASQLQKLMHKNFLLETPYYQLQHFPRYLKAVYLRLDKLRADPLRDTDRMKQIAPLEQQFWREWSARKGVPDSRLVEYRWLLEELRVSLFAQELKTPQPVSVKRLERAWIQLKA